MSNVEIKIQAIVDKAIADIKKVSGAVDGLDNSTKDFSGGGGASFTSAMLGINAALEIGQKVFQAAKAIHEETVGVFIEYAAQVRDMARATGESVEESSRMIQMADDVGLSYDKLKTSLQMAARQGIDTSVESLKAMSEEYLTLAPGTERMQFLLERFGRSGAEMGRLLEMGADGIEQLSGSVESGLILTPEILKQARAHEILADALADEIQQKKILAGIAIGGIEDDAMLNRMAYERMNNMIREQELVRGEIMSANKWP